MKTENLKVGEIYKFKNLCDLLGVEYVSTGVKKIRLLEDFERYFKSEKIGLRYKVLEIYPEPLAGFENGFFYKTAIVPVKCSKDDYEYLKKCNEWSAECWNMLILADNEKYKKENCFMTRGELQSFVKSKTPLHATGNQHVFVKYYTARDAIFRSRKATHNKALLPYKKKIYYNTAWSLDCARVDYKNNKIFLAKKALKRGTYQKPICCSAKNIPSHIVEIELIYKNKLCLAIKYKEPKLNTDIISNNVAGIDLGEIHSIASIDNNGNAIIITGRKLRDIKRFRNKESGKLLSLMSKCKNGSIQFNKYHDALQHLIVDSDNKIRDCVHKISKMYLDYCINNNISKVYCGDLDSCTRNTHGRHHKKTNQKLAQWNYGELIDELENKLSRYGIEIIKISEAYTSQTCPHCGTRHKPTNRNYKCKCGYEQHRDLVGAMNILNFYEGEIHIEKYKSLKYLRID